MSMRPCSRGPEAGQLSTRCRCLVRLGPAAKCRTGGGGMAWKGKPDLQVFSLAPAATAAARDGCWVQDHECRLLRRALSYMMKWQGDNKGYLATCIWRKEMSIKVAGYGLEDSPEDHRSSAQRCVSRGKYGCRNAGSASNSFCTSSPSVRRGEVVCLRVGVESWRRRTEGAGNAEGRGTVLSDPLMGRGEREGR